MDKAPDAFRTISEVADVLQTPAHVLRFWESRFTQIRPVKRAAGGRRYYRPSDVALLAGIRRLLHDEGLTIRGVQKILREQGVRHVAGFSDADVALPDAFDAIAGTKKDKDAAAPRVLDFVAHARAVVTADKDEADMPEPEPEEMEATEPEPVVTEAAEPEPVAAFASEPAGVVQTTLDLFPEPGQPWRDDDAVPASAPAASPAAPRAPGTLPADGIWLPTLLRRLPPGALDARQEALLPLFIRLKAVRDQMAPANRAG